MEKLSNFKFIFFCGYIVGIYVIIDYIVGVYGVFVNIEFEGVLDLSFFLIFI